MKIAQIHPYPPIINNQVPKLPGDATQGGGETSSYYFAQKLAENGHDITYYAGKYKGINTKELVINPHFKVRYVDLIIFKNMGPALSFELFISLWKNNYDVIQSHQIPIMFSVIAGIVAKLKRKKFIMTFHGRVYAIWIDYLIGRLASFLSDAITVQNKFSYDLVKTFVDKDKLKIIPHGVDTNIFNRKKHTKSLIKTYKPNSEKIVLFIGRLIPAKGVHILINAISQVDKKNKVKLLIIGAGPLKDDLKILVKHLGLEDQITFVGLVEQYDLPEFYSLADIFVLPSVTRDINNRPIPKVSENFGNVLAEAMACEVPIVASKVGGIPYWIKDRENGFLFKEGDTKQLSSILNELFKNEELKKKIVKKAKNDIDTKYSWDVIIKDFEGLYNK